MTPDQQVAQMERIIGYTFHNRQLAVESLYHGGLPIYFNGAFSWPKRNERLALLGDSILDTVLLKRWYRTRDSQGALLSRGQWNGIIHEDLVTNRELAIRGRELGLDVCVIKDPGTTAVSTIMMATTMEAIIAAVFEDSGANALDIVGRIMDRLGFYNHAFFLVTYCEAPPFCFANIQMITNMQYLDPD